MNKEGGISSGMYRLLGVESSTLGQMFREDLDGNGTMSYIIETNAPQLQSSNNNLASGNVRNIGGSKTKLSPVRNSHPTENSKVALNILQQTMKSADNNFEGNVLIENQLTFIEVDDFTKHAHHLQLQNQNQSGNKNPLQAAQKSNKLQNESGPSSANFSPKKSQKVQNNQPIAINRNELLYPPTHNKKLDLIGKTKYSSNSSELHYLAKYREELLEPEEKALYEVPNDINSDEMKIARDILCNRGNDLRQVKIHEFRKYMDNDKILDYCSKMLYDSLLFSERQFEGENNFQQRNKHFQTNVQDIKDLLRTIDKYLFVMFRNEEITLDQLKARIAEKNQNVKYVVLDDLRKSLQPEILEGVPDEIFYKLYKTQKNSEGKQVVSLKEMQKGLQPWQTDNRCLRSLYYEKKPEDNQTNESVNINYSSSPFRNVKSLYQDQLTANQQTQSQNDEKVDIARSRNLKEKGLLNQRNNTTTDTNAQNILSSKKGEEINNKSPLRNDISPQSKFTLQKSKSQQKSSASKSDNKNQGVKFRLPSKFEQRDYKQFVSQMTYKIKEELQRELVKRDRAEKMEVLREEFNSRKEQIEKSLLEEFGPASTRLVVTDNPDSLSPPKKAKSFFHINTKSYALKNIREKLDQESLKVQGMLFLKQLEMEGRGQIVWEKSTLEIMQHMAEEKFKMENTDYERALKPRKPRPKDVIAGQVQSQTDQIQQRYEALMDKMAGNSSGKGSFDAKITSGGRKQSLISGELEFLLRHSKRNSIGEFPINENNSLGNTSSIQLKYSPYKNLPELKSRSLIRIEEETPSYTNNNVNNTFHDGQNNSTQNVSTLHQFPLEQDSRIDVIGGGGVIVQEMNQQRVENYNFILGPMSQRSKAQDPSYSNLKKDENSKTGFNLLESTTIEESPEKAINRTIFVKGSSGYNSNSDFGIQGAFSQRIDSKENQSMIIQQNSTINTSTIQNNTSIYDAQNQKVWVKNTVDGSHLLNSQKEMRAFVLQGEGLKNTDYFTGTTISNEDSNMNSHRSLVIKHPPTLQTAFYQPHPQSSSLPRMAQMYQTYQSQQTNQLNLNQSQKWDQSTQNLSQSYFNQPSWAQTPGQDIAVKKMFPARNYTSNQARRNFNFIQSHSLNHQKTQKQETNQSGIMIRNQDMYKQKPSTAGRMTMSSNAGRSTATGGSRPKHQNHRKLKDFMITQRLADVLMQNEIPVQVTYDSMKQQKEGNIITQQNSQLKPFTGDNQTRAPFQGNSLINRSRIDTASSITQGVETQIFNQPKSAQRTRNKMQVDQFQSHIFSKNVNFFSGHSSLSRKSANHYQGGQGTQHTNPQHFSVTALLEHQNAASSYPTNKNLANALNLNQLTEIEAEKIGQQQNQFNNLRLNSGLGIQRQGQFQENCTSIQRIQTREDSKTKQHQQVKQHNFFQNNFIKSSDMRKYHHNFHNNMKLSNDTSMQMSEDVQAFKLPNRIHDSNLAHQNDVAGIDHGSGLGNFNKSSFSPESIRLVNRFQNSSAVQNSSSVKDVNIVPSHFKTLTGEQMSSFLQPAQASTQQIPVQTKQFTSQMSISSVVKFLPGDQLDVHLHRDAHQGISSSLQGYHNCEEMEKDLMSNKFMISRFKRLEDQKRKQAKKEREEKSKISKQRETDAKVRESHKSLPAKSQHSQTTKTN